MSAALRIAPDPAPARTIADVLTEKRRRHPELARTNVSLEALLAIAARERIGVITMRGGISDRIRRVVVLYVIACTSWGLADDEAYAVTAELLGLDVPITEAVLRCAAAERLQ